MQSEKLKTDNEKRKVKSGFTLLEILVGAGILTASFLGVLTVFDRLTRASQQMVELSQANFLLEEGLEIGRIFRDDDWANLSKMTIGADYFLSWNAGKWATSSNNVFLDSKFDRRLKLSQVFRDSNDDIIPLGGGGGTLDPFTKLLTISVAWWGDGATTTKTLATYLTNLFE